MTSKSPIDLTTPPTSPVSNRVNALLNAVEAMSDHDLPAPAPLVRQNAVGSGQLSNMMATSSERKERVDFPSASAPKKAPKRKASEMTAPTEKKDSRARVQARALAITWSQISKAITDSDPAAKLQLFKEKALAALQATKWAPVKVAAVSPEKHKDGSYHAHGLVWYQDKIRVPLSEVCSALTVDGLFPSLVNSALMWTESILDDSLLPPLTLFPLFMITLNSLFWILVSSQLFALTFQLSFKAKENL